MLAILATIGSGSIASAEVAAPNCPKAFQGFHLGGNIGYGVGDGKQKAFAGVEDGVGSATSNNLGVRGVDGGIGVGYTHRFGNWGLGLAFDANWANSKGRNNFGSAVDVGGNGDDDETFTSKTTAKARLKNSLQLYARAGYVIGGMSMPFVGLGWDNSSWNQRVSGNGITASKTKRHNALLWKAGVDFLATKHVVVGFEYTGTYAGKKSFSKHAGNLEASSSYKPQYNKFALTAKIVY
ncbi:MAG: porin family protein [Proteobacteria bacterium]|nr:porin family protein [Pseudomonadota bacterium]